MINHGRVLLANHRASNGDFAAYIAEEFTPEDFVPVALPAYLRRIRATLFGTDPDRDCINYRCQQLLTILHQTPFAAYLTALDGRLTYATGRAAALVPTRAFGVTVTALDPDDYPASLVVISGQPAAPDGTGRLHQRFTIHITATVHLAYHVVQVHRTMPPPDTGDAFSFHLVDGLSEELMPLTGSGYSFRLATDGAFADWQVDVFNRPQADVGTLVADALVLNEDVARLLAGPEPYKTFRNLWGQHELPGRVAGLVLGLIYRTNELWRATRATG